MSTFLRSIFGFYYLELRASLVAQAVKNPPAVRESQVWTLGLKDPLEKGVASHGIMLAWRIPWTEEPAEYSSMRVAKSPIWLSNQHSLFTFHFIRVVISSVQSLSHLQLFVTPWTAALQDSPSITNSRSLLNSCPWSWWCHPTTSSSVIPFSSCLQSFPTSGFFLESQFFSSGGQSIGGSASASVLPMNIQDWFPLRLT